jgi:hypothetical protein
MSRILTSGNELGDYTAEGWFNGQNASGAINAAGGAPTPGGNGGRYYFLLQNQQEIRYQFPLSYQEAYGRFHLYGGGSCGGERSVWKWYQGSQELLRLKMVDYGNPNAGFRLARWFDDSTIVSSGGSGPLWFNWCLVEWYMLMNGSGGKFRLWINGNKVIEFNGSVTGHFGETQFDTVALTQTNNNNGTPNYFDNVAMNDPNTGTVNVGRCLTGWSISYSAKEQGGFNQLVNNFGNSNNNFQSVAWPNALTNGYVGTNTPGQKDTYEYVSTPVEFAGCKNLRASMYVVRNGPAITKVQGVHLPLEDELGGGTETDFPAGGTALPSGGFSWVNIDQESDPTNSNNPFPINHINHDQLGVKFLA